MPFTTTTFRVAIASPGDVREERRVLRQVIHDWNAAHAMTRTTVLLPVGWESDTAPLMGPRAQEVINSQMIGNADLLVAAFWTRLGTPSGKAQSGTVEEIQEFLAAGKPVMIYFSDAPVQAGSVDQQQWDALQEFKSWCDKNGLIGRYDSVLELRERFSRELALLVNTHPSLARGEVSAFTPAPISPRPHDPLDDLSEEALVLLDEVTLDPDATLVVAEYIGGLSVETNGKSFIPEGDARTAALYRDAVDKLLDHQLIRDLGSKHQLFQPTAAGYKAAEKLRTTRPPPQRP